MSLSPRTWIELIGTAVLGGIVVWLLLGKADLKADLADARTSIQLERLKTQAADVSATSCQAALTSVQSSTRALVVASEALASQADTAVQRGLVRDQEADRDIQALLAVRAPPNRDCEVAKSLAQDAWEHPDE